MASKEVKSALKAAREAIRSKDFKEALKQCKSALAEDPNNYNALVFVGVATEGLEQFDQSLKAYRRAAQVSPDQLLAWQGLSTMHSKKPELIPDKEMVAVYEKLVKLYDSDKEKQQDAIAKLVCLLGDSDVEKLLGLCDRLEKEGRRHGDILLQLISVLTKQPQLKPDQEAKLLSGLEELLFTTEVCPQDAVNEQHAQTYLRLLQKREPEILFEKCSKLASGFPRLCCPVETKIRLLLDRQMAQPKAEEVEDIKTLASSLVGLREGGEKSAVQFLADGYLALREGKSASAKDLLQQGVKKMKTLYCGHFYLAQTLFKLRDAAGCLQVCQEAQQVECSQAGMVSVDPSCATQHLLLLATRCCLRQGTKLSLAQALTHLDKLSQGSEEADILRAYVCLELGDKEQLQSCLDRVRESRTTEVTALTAWVHFHSQDYAAAVSKLQQCVSENAASADYLLMLGRALWEQRSEGAGLQDQCFNTLLKAAKLDPNLSGTFLYLGHFYAELKKDQQRAKKCYQKSYDLDPNNEEAGAALCDMMMGLGEEQSVQNLLQRVTDTASAGCGKWAWLRLGLAQVRTGDPSSATASFQSALRADPEDRHVWECLAEAYLHRGSFTAALKAFGKAAELHPDSTYCLYQMASIKQKLGVLTEAADEYRLTLDKSAHYVPALKGLGETHLLITQRYLAQCLFGLAKDNCEKAIACLTRAATQRPDLSCLWKLMGDCCTVLHPLHSPSFSLTVPQRLCQAAVTAQDGGDGDGDTVDIGKTQLLELATRCYGRALKILPDSAPLWHDLGVSFFYLVKEKSGEADRRPLVDKCVRALKKALSLDAGNHMHWTALGVVAASPYMKNPSLAQHCFIKSIESETNNAVAWTNLGTLYLMHENIQLAHEAFSVAQSADPDYMNSWVGQALVAEAVGHNEAMDLFRHSTELGIHMESCAGYGHWVLSTLLDVKRQDTEAFQFCIKQMSAVTAACDALTRYTAVMQDDPCAFNMLGLLLEHQELNVSALSAFHRAAELAGQQGTDRGVLTKIRLNLARLLSKNQQYREAVGVYESHAASCSFADVCQWGLTLFKADQLQNSYKVYEQALTLAETDGDKSDVCAALGMVAHRAGLKDAAKDALFQGFQSSSPSLQGLFALCALGLLQGDLTLTQATLQELSTRVTGGDNLTDVATLTAAFKVQQGEGSAAMDGVEELQTANSHVAGLSLLMSRLALQLHSGLTAEASAKTALTTASPAHKDALLCLAMSQLSVGKHSRRNPADNAIRTAQKALHSRPDDAAALCCLAGAVHAEAVLRFVAKGNTALLAQEVRLLDLALTLPEVSGGQRRWCLQQKGVAQVMLGDDSGAGLTLTQLSSEFPDESELAPVLQCVLRGEQSQLEPLVIRDGTHIFFWQILLVGLLKEQRWAEAGVLLKEALGKARSTSGHVVKIVCLVSVAWLAALQLWNGHGGGDNGGSLSELEDASQAVGEVSKKAATLTQVLQGLVHLETNPRKAKHHLANVLEPGASGSRCLGVETSLARRGIVFLLKTSAKDTEQELVQKLLAEAKAGGDMATVEFYQNLHK